MNSSSSEKQCTTREYYLRMSKYFQWPINLLQRVYEQQVVLENIFIRGLTTYGTIRVNNCSFNKNVFVRFTIDQWRTSSVIEAYYSTHYSDNNTDVFQFKLTLSNDKLLISSSKILSFVICYRVDGETFWDNNYTQNYNLDIIENTHKETTFSIIHNDVLHKQIAQDYHAISNPSHQSGGLCGLKNLGGTCYMNSVLQSLSFSSLLTNYFFSNKLISKGIVLNEYLNLLYLLCCGKYGVLTPAPFKQVIGHVQYVYLRDQQQDAHEFLIFLLDYLNKELIDSIIVDLFYGTYQSTITCTECMHSSRRLEPFVCLTVPIPLINQCTLEDCLAYLSEEEYLIDDSRWFCPECRCLCNAKRRFEIYKLPKILIIQLKRFQMDYEMNLIKNDTLVLYPEDNLNLHQYCSSKESFYTLYSVINHNGSLNDGHYTTFSRDISLNEQVWFEYDDETIKYLEEDKLHLNSKAYLLFYTIKTESESTKL